MPNKITDVTRQEIIDLYTLGFYSNESESDVKCFWSGRLEEPDFLSRLYDLKSMRSTDGRFSDAYGDIWQHRVNNSDWEDEWVFYDGRFSLKSAPDEEFLRFLCETFHPVVRDEKKDWKQLLTFINDLLRVDGYELYEQDHVSGRPKYGWRKTSLHSINVQPPPIQPAYELKLIGEGSYAHVFKYKDKYYNKTFVLKRAKKELNAKEVIRFKREFENMNSLKSPYIVEVYCYYEARNEYVMEYMDFTLDSYIKKNNATLDIAKRKGLGLQILKAFAYIHSKGLLHRDISPSNVLIKVYDDIVVAKISDFGLVRTPDSNLTSLGTEFKGLLNDPSLVLEGFANYNMPHEMYALTRLLYFVLTGRTNVDNITDASHRAFVEKGLNPDKEKRYKNIDELTDSFRSIR